MAWPATCRDSSNRIASTKRKGDRQEIDVPGAKFVWHCLLASYLAQQSNQGRSSLESHSGVSADRIVAIFDGFSANLLVDVTDSSQCQAANRPLATFLSNMSLHRILPMAAVVQVSASPAGALRDASLHAARMIEG